MTSSPSRRARRPRARSGRRRTRGRERAWRSLLGGAEERRRQRDGAADAQRSNSAIVHGSRSRRRRRLRRSPRCRRRAISICSRSQRHLCSRASSARGRPVVDTQSELHRPNILPGWLKPGHTFRLCLDTDGVRFRSEGLQRQPCDAAAAIHLANLQWLRPLRSAGRCNPPGGYYCGFVPKALSLDMPPFTCAAHSAQFGAIIRRSTPPRYTFIDAEATQGPSTTSTGSTASRRGSTAGCAAVRLKNMTWVVKPAQSGGSPRLLRTSCLSEFPPASYMNGQRDFNTNHTIDVEKELNPPAGVKCTSTARRCRRTPPRGRV